MEVLAEDIEELKSVYDIDFENLVIVHAGRWWPSKTFPKEWWQEVVNGLAAKGIKVALIGRTIGEEQGYVDIDCPKGCYDFRDLTSLGAMIALISLSKVTLTNDSAPVHIAGAFDNWLIVIPTCKCPDHILPFRKATQYYKTMALYKKLVIDDLDILWLSEKPDTIDILKKDIYEYLPDVVEVINAVDKIMNKNQGK